MSVKEIERSIQEAIGYQIEVIEEGNDRYPIYTPFTMEDGAHFNIVLKGDAQKQSWVLTDEGSTLLHLSYWMDYDALKKGQRQQVVESALRQFGVTYTRGELSLVTPFDNLGSSIFTFLQCLSRITDITYLSKEIARATFMEDFKDFIRENIPEEHLTFDYHHPQFDRGKIYPIDVRRNERAEPLYIFGIANNDRCRDVTISLHTYKRWGIEFQSVAIFQDQTTISRDVLARFSDVADKQFSSLDSSRVEIANYLKKKL